MRHRRPSRRPAQRLLSSTARRFASAASAPTRSLLIDPLCPLPTIFAIGNNGGARVCAAAVNSQNHTHSFCSLSIFPANAAIVAQRSRQDIQAAVGLGRIEAEHVRHPRIQIHVIKRSHRFSRAQDPVRRQKSWPSSPASVCGSKPCMPAVGGRSVCPAAGACARIAYGPVATTTGSPSRGFWLKFRPAGTSLQPKDHELRRGVLELVVDAGAILLGLAVKQRARRSRIRSDRQTDRG